MNSIAVFAYVLSVLLLFLKTVMTTLVQAKVRLSTRHFQYPEDAACWKGEHVTAEAPLVDRAQRVLRNDSETQAFSLVFGGAYVTLGAWPLGAVGYFGVYVLSRLLHAYWFLRPTQPHRNLAFVVGLVSLLTIAVHCLVAAAQRLTA